MFLVYLKEEVLPAESLKAELVLVLEMSTIFSMITPPMPPIITKMTTSLILEILKNLFNLGIAISTILAIVSQDPSLAVVPEPPLQCIISTFNIEVSKKS